MLITNAKRSILSFILLLSASISNAQGDAADCADNRFIKRMAGAHINLCSSGKDMVEMPVTDSITEMKSGERFYAQYSFNPEKNPVPAFGDIVQDVERQVISSKGKRIFSNIASGTATYFLMNGRSEEWILVNENPSIGPGGYELVIVEVEPRKISALTLLDDLSTSGKAVLPLRFEPGKTVITSESSGLIDVIVDLLSNESDLNISIESHTGNRNADATSQLLSENRAKAVYDAVITKGINKERLKYKGYGDSKPIADNNTDEGRQKNDRIELVKQ